MIVEIISKYLQTNRRLVVPNLGAFIVKETGRKILFSNLIKADDGVLRSLLAENGISELEAAGTIDRFVFEVNFRLENMGFCRLGGFGELRSGANGTISFNFQPSTEGENLDGNIDQKIAERDSMRRADAAEADMADDDQEPIEITVAPRSEQVKPADVSPAEDLELEPKAAKEPAQRQREFTSRPKSDYVEGLRYGKGRKVVTGREGVISRKRGYKGDAIIKIAIAAAVIATLALAYGFYNNWRNSQYLNEGLYDEPQTIEAESSAEQGVRNPDLDYITPNEN